jgi:hypothetical protein
MTLSSLRLEAVFSLQFVESVFCRSEVLHISYSKLISSMNTPKTKTAHLAGMFPTRNLKFYGFLH